MAHRNTFYYDQASNVTCVRDDDLGLTYYTYDLADRMTSVKNPFGEVTYYEYLDCDQVGKRTLGNGCLTYYEYDVKDRVTKIDHRESDMTQLAELQYEYDKVGNPIKIEREDGSATYYEYDKTYQLTAETQVDDQTQVEYAFAYEYDGAHNRTVKVADGTPTYYTYNAANQMLTEATGAATTYYHYDGCGNTTAKQAPAGTTYYQYDTENLMTRVDFPDDTHSYYTYDADGKRRSERTVDGYLEFIYQGPDMLKLQMERDEEGETQVQYTMGNGLEAMRRDVGGGVANGDSSFYHYNHLGTTVALTNAAESVTDTYRHDAWGMQLARTGSTVNPHTYVGQQRYYRMPNASLYHLGFRDYAQEVGRFTTVDPARIAESFAGLGVDAGVPWYSVGEVTEPVLGLGAVKPRCGRPSAPLDLDRYSYVGNSSVVRVDPSGQWFQIIICGIAVCLIITLPGCPPRQQPPPNPPIQHPPRATPTPPKPCSAKTAMEDPEAFLTNCPVSVWDGSLWMQACAEVCRRRYRFSVPECQSNCCEAGFDPRGTRCGTAMIPLPAPVP